MTALSGAPASTVTFSISLLLPLGSALTGDGITAGMNIRATNAVESNHMIGVPFRERSLGEAA